MTDETPEPIPSEDQSKIAPGIALALAPQPETSDDSQRRRRRGEQDTYDALRKWQPKTRLGRMVIDGNILSYEQAIDTGLPIREVEIIDALLPGLEDHVINVNMIQRMTDSGRRVRFNVMACVGNGDGYVGLAICKGKDVASTIRKAIDIAKLDIIQVMRGNGSWESGPGGGTSIPFKVTGRCGSTRVTLIPAPAGKGLVIGETGRAVLRLAGITDIYSKTRGQTRTTINFARATFNALKQLNAARVSDEQKTRMFMNTGRNLG